jgi:hypothetical protein
MKRRGIGVPSDPMRANHTPAPWVCAMIGGSAVGARAGGWEFPVTLFSVQRLWTLCYCDSALRAVMGEMRGVICRGEERGVRNREGA